MKDHQNSEFNFLLTALKRILKERGISYRVLGQKIGISESGVKNIFLSKDASYVRLTQIADVLNCKILDILEDIQHSKFENLYLSTEQQNLFLKDHLLFSVYFKLVLERASVEEVKAELELSENTLFKYLKKLDELKLLKLFPKNVVKLPPLKTVRNFGSGPFLSKLYREWGQLLVNDLADPQFQNSGHFIVRCLKMKEDTYNEFLGRLQDLEKEFTRRAFQEMSISTKGLQTSRWMSFTDNKSFVSEKFVKK